MSKELATLSDAVKNYPALQGDPTKLLAVMRENMGGEKMTEFDLDRVKMPSGGGIAWEVPTLDGPEPAKVIEGVVVLAKTVRAYWPLAMEEGSGSDPPQCSSPDGVIGVGDPGIECELCPLSKFGSSTKPGREKAQACKQMRQLFLLTPDSLLPLVITLPPSSLKAARTYFMRLGAQGRYYWTTTTKLGLEKVTGQGVDYSVATLAVGTSLTDADAVAITAYKDALEPILATRLPTASEAAGA